MRFTRRLNDYFMVPINYANDANEIGQITGFYYNVSETLINLYVIFIQSRWNIPKLPKSEESQISLQIGDIKLLLNLIFCFNLVLILQIEKVWVPNQ